MLADLKGIVTLLIGGGAGIGKYMAKALWEAGATLICISKEYEITFPDDCYKFEGDIFDEKFLKQCIEKIKKKQLNIDVLINNIGYGTNDFCEKIEEYELQKMIDLNVRSHLYLFKILFKDSYTRPRQVISISSTFSRVALPTLSVYAATKCALLALVKNLAEKYSDISFICVCPGYMKHKKHVKYFQSEYGKRFMKEKIPLKRVGDPQDELAPIIALLCSPIYRDVHYMELFVDGGLSAHVSMEE